MDEAYDSPDSDGHASIPSPTETSFNMSTLQNARPWPPASPSPSPGGFSDDEDGHDEDDEPVVVFQRGGFKSSKSMLPSALDSSSSASRVLKPTTFNDSVNSSLRPNRTKRSSENLLPRKSAEMTSDQESTAGDATEIPIVAGPSGIIVDDAEGYGLPSPELSPSSSPEPPEPASTPDHRTGLPKRIVVRKNWNNPIKESQARSVPSSGEPSPALQYDGEDEDESAEPAASRRMASAPDQSTPQPTDGDAEAPEPTLPEMHPEDTPDRPVDTVNRPQAQSRLRNVSGMSNASVARHEAFEEIDPSSLMERLSQSSEPALPQRMPAQTRSISFHSLPSLEQEPEVAKVSGDISDSAVPHTPPNKKITRKKYLPSKGVNFSLKRDTSTSFRPPITPKKALFANGPMATTAKGKQPSTSSRPQNGGILIPPSSPPGHPGPSNPKAADLPHREGNFEQDISVNSKATEESPDPSSPQRPYRNFDLWKFKNSKAARRVSINSPASAMSATDSPAFQQEHPSPSSDFEAPQNNPLPAGPLFKDKQQRNGTMPPVNTPAAARDARQPEVDHDKVRTRERSRSDPLDLRGNDGNELPTGQLFDPSRTRKMDEDAPDPNKGAPVDSKAVQDVEEGSSTVGESPPNGQRIVEIRSSRPSSSVGVLETRPAVKDAQDNRDNDNAGRLWSGFSEDLSDSYRRFEPDETAIHKKVDDSSQAIVTSSPGLGDVVVRIQTPASVAGNDSEATPRDTESIHRRNAELQSILARVLSQNEELRSKTREQSELLAQYEEEYGEAHGEIETHRERVRILENRVKELSRKKSIETLSPSSSSPRQQHQRIAELRAKVDSLEHAAKQQADSHRRENEEYEQKIQHLTAALDQKVGSTINEPLQKRIVELEAQLEKERKAHSEDMAKTEDKYKQILAENDGMINHLQAELDEYAGQLPMDPGDRTSRIFDGDDNGEWGDERSREVSQLVEDSYGQIITQIGGDPDREDFDEQAVMDAEKSLRYLAATAGYDNLNKADLAAFGIKYLRDDNAHYKGLHAQSEEKVKQLIAANNSLTTELETLKERVKELETQNGVLQNTISDNQTTIERLQGEMKEHQVRITEANRALEDALQENEKSDAKIKASEAELATLQQAYTRDQKELERSMARLAQAEQKAKEQEQHLTELRTQLQETTGRDSTLQAEVDAYKQRTSELLRTVETADKTHKDRVMALEEQIDDLRAAKETLIKERDAAREADKRTAELSGIIFKLEEKIAESDEALAKLKAEKEALEIATYKAETESKQARSRFNVLLHESAEKETIWNTVKAQLQTEIEQKTRELHHAVEPYEKALEIIAAEVDEIAPERESDDEECKSLQTGLVNDGIAAPGIVADVLVGVRTLDALIDGIEAQRKDLEGKNQRLKNAIKKWNAENNREKIKVEALRKENKELALRLKAEKKQSDEKIGQLILALRG